MMLAAYKSFCKPLGLLDNGFALLQMAAGATISCRSEPIHSDVTIDQEPQPMLRTSRSADRFGSSCRVQSAPRQNAHTGRKSRPRSKGGAADALTQLAAKGSADVFGEAVASFLPRTSDPIVSSISLSYTV